MVLPLNLMVKYNWSGWGVTANSGHTENAKVPIFRSHYIRYITSQ